MITDEGGFFGTVKPCPYCMGGRNIQMGVGPQAPCGDCEGSGLIIKRGGSADLGD